MQEILASRVYRPKCWQEVGEDLLHF